MCKRELAGERCERIAISREHFGTIAVLEKTAAETQRFERCAIRLRQLAGECRERAGERQGVRCACILATERMRTREHVQAANRQAGGYQRLCRGMGFLRRHAEMIVPLRSRGSTR